MSNSRNIIPSQAQSTVETLLRIEALLRKLVFGVQALATDGGKVTDADFEAFDQEPDSHVDSPS